MGILGVLANPGVGNLLLVIAAIIGVCGSYVLYKKRLKDRRKATRRTLKSEIESTKILDTWIRKNEVNELPAQIVHPTTAYENHVDEIGLLTDEEIELISEFYSEAILLNDTLKWNRESELEISANIRAIDKSREQRIRDITRNLDQLAVKRWKAAQILRKHLGEEYTSIKYMEVPTSEGDVVSKDHPVIKPRIEKLVEEGYLKQVDNESNLYELTKEGEEFFDVDSDSKKGYDLDNELSLT